MILKIEKVKPDGRIQEDLDYPVLQVESDVESWNQQHLLLDPVDPGLH